MKRFVIAALLMSVLWSGQALAQATADGDAMAARMNRDYDYPGDPSDQQYVKMPPLRQQIRYEREMAKYMMTRRAQAKAQWQAMTPDEKRAFIQGRPIPFAGGPLYGE